MRIKSNCNLRVITMIFAASLFVGCASNSLLRQLNYHFSLNYKIEVISEDYKTEHVYYSIFDHDTSFFHINDSGGCIALIIDFDKDNHNNLKIRLTNTSAFPLFLQIPPSTYDFWGTLWNDSVTANLGRVQFANGYLIENHPKDLLERKIAKLEPGKEMIVECPNFIKVFNPQTNENVSLTIKQGHYNLNLSYFPIYLKGFQEKDGNCFSCNRKVSNIGKSGPNKKGIKKISLYRERYPVSNTILIDLQSAETEDVKQR
jgi:hypothetical protein